MGAAKNICCMKGKGIVNNITVIRWLKKFCLVYENLNDQARSNKPRSVDSEGVLQAIEANQASNT